MMHKQLSKNKSRYLVEAGLIFMEAYLILISGILSLYFGSIRGTVTLSPSGIASVCQGDQLELICNVTGSVLEWRINVTSASSYRIYRRGVISEGQTFTQTYHLMINDSILLSFSRISNEGASPLVSRLLINPVNEDLNGTNMVCEADQISSLQSTTTIAVVWDSLQDLSMDPNLVNLTERQNFEMDGVIVTLKWVGGSSLHTYYISVIPPVPFIFNGSTLSVMFDFSYNITYNVSVQAELFCGNNVTIITKLLYYSYCRDPNHQIEETVSVFGYVNPAVPGSSVTFGCSSPGYSLTGSNTSICMGNGEWEPDPAETIKCKVNCGPPSPPPNYVTIFYTNTLEGAEATVLCQSTLQLGQQSLCRQINITAVCNKEGNWEPLIGDMCFELSGSSLSEGGKIAIASIISVFLTSSLFLFFGYCCYCYHQKLRGQQSPSSATQPAPAYESVHPTDHDTTLLILQYSNYHNK